MAEYLVVHSLAKDFQYEPEGILVELFTNYRCSASDRGLPDLHTIGMYGKSGDDRIPGREASFACSTGAG